MQSKSNPALRAAATGSVVSYDEIIDALQSLDAGHCADTMTYAFKRRQRRRRWSDCKGRRSGGSDNGDVGSNTPEQFAPNLRQAHRLDG